MASSVEVHVSKPTSSKCNREEFSKIIRLQLIQDLQSKDVMHSVSTQSQSELHYATFISIEPLLSGCLRSANQVDNRLMERPLHESCEVFMIISMRSQ